MKTKKAYIVGHHDIHMTVYAPSDDLLELIRTLAGAEGLFVWKVKEDC